MTVVARRVQAYTVRSIALDASLRELVTVAITNATENRVIYPGKDVQTSTLKIEIRI